MVALSIAQASVVAASENSMKLGKERLESCAARLAARLGDVSADLDPELLQLPGGSLIATLFWLYAKGATALRRH
jgi:hypothetical protein